jgi:maltose O-acetyltransferase
VHTTGRVEVVADGDVTIGNNVTLFGGMIPTRLTCGSGAELMIGDGTELNFGVRVHALRSVRIGGRCMIAPFVEIDDSVDDASIPPLPIVIEDDVWLAYGAVITPGRRIGAGAVVAAGSVVKSDVPRLHLAIGSPARCIPLESIPTP